MYADDSALHLSGRGVADFQYKIQSDLNLTDKWCSENKMYINIEKIYIYIWRWETAMT